MIWIISSLVNALWRSITDVLQGHTTGRSARQYALDEVHVYANGKIVASTADVTSASLDLSLTATLRLHAGGKLEVSLASK